MSRTPVAFMSYVRMDDEHEQGRLTQFCERLSGEVRMQTGEAFEIFFDRKHITWGQEWKSRTNDQLDQVTFLIAVITPAFFKSKECRGELERFLAREEKLNRSDLVLPLYYVECTTLSDEAKREKDGLARAIAGRQHADWRELRFEPFTSPEIGKRLAKMARQIVEALERSQLVPNPAPLAAAAPPADRSGPGEAGQAVEGTPAAASATAPGPVAKTSVPTLVVDALHRGDHPTIGEALKVAAPGTRILVRPGLYREGVVIEKPVEIVGDGEPGDVVIEAEEMDVILFKTTMGRVANLTLRQRGGGAWYGVDIAQGRLDLEGCDITSEALSCVAIHDGADPRLRRNRLHDGAEGGVLVYENGLGTLEDNEIYHNTFSGVEVRNGSHPTLRRNRIFDGKEAGVLVHESGQCTMDENDIFANALAGVQVRGGAHALLRRNRVHDGQQAGVFVNDNGTATLEENDIAGNAYAGVCVKSGGNPLLLRNKICRNKQSGVYVYENGLGTIEDNEIFENGGAGIVTESGGAPTARRNKIAKNAYEAIWVATGGAGVFENNDLRANKRGPWDIHADSAANVKKSGNREK